MDSLGRNVSTYLAKQLENLFPDGEPPGPDLGAATERALLSLKTCFSHLKPKYFQGPFETTFNRLNGDHWAMFLYRVSHAVHTQEGNQKLASKIFLLNKALHGIDAFYRVELPEVFLFAHPLGTILGNARYGNFFCAYQGVTVGSKIVDGGYVYPRFGERTVLLANASVIGDCEIGANVAFGAGASLIDGAVAANSLVLGAYPNNRIRPLERDVPGDYFRY